MMHNTVAQGTVPCVIMARCFYTSNTLLNSVTQILQENRSLYSIGGGFMDTILLRKTRIICVLLLVLFLLGGCDVYAGKRPNDYPNSVWRCQEEKMTIIVNNDGIAYFTANEDVITFHADPEYYVLFDYGNQILIVRASTNETIMSGDCSFSSKVLQVTIGTDNLFDGKYQFDSLSFYKQ